jgi:hypothetical protein
LADIGRTDIKLASDLTVLLTDRPGSLAEVGESLGKAGVNVEGFFGFSLNNMAWAHILVDDVVRAKEALKGVVDIAEENEVLVVELDDHPGALGEATRRLAEASVNLRFAYLGTGTRLVIAPNDMERARQALETISAGA